MNKMEVNEESNGIGNVLIVAFSRIPFFELAFVIIIVVEVWTLPEILRSINNENFLPGCIVCVVMLILMVICILGIFSRKGFYKLFYTKDTKDVPTEKLQIEENDELARKEIEKASRGSIE